MMTHTIEITADRDCCPVAVATITSGLRSMAAKEAAYATYLDACAAYQAAEDAANTVDASPEVLAKWRAADEACEAARAAWMAL